MCTLQRALVCLIVAGGFGCSSGGNRPAPTVVPRPLEAPPERASTPGAGSPGAGAPGAASVAAPVNEPPTVAASAGPASGATGPSDPSAGGAEQGTPTAVPAGRELLVATVGGTRIELEQLLGAWLRRDGAGVRTLLDDLVLSRIVELEAARFGTELPPNLVRRALEKRRELLTEEAKKAGEPDLETFVERRLGLEPERYFAGLERELAVDLLASRVVRAWLLTSERAEVRVISVKGQEARDRVQAKLAAGQDFAAVATELSEDPSKEEGGRMTPVVRGESALARLAFATPLGEVAGPLDERGRYLFMKVDARPELAAGPWSVLGVKVEASLAARSIEDPEYWQWQQAMQAVYEVDLEPFRALLGSKL
jgi:hypothetical protein